MALIPQPLRPISYAFSLSLGDGYCFCVDDLLSVFFLLLFLLLQAYENRCMFLMTNIKKCFLLSTVTPWKAIVNLRGKNLNPTSSKCVRNNYMLNIYKMLKYSNFLLKLIKKVVQFNYLN